MKGPIILLAGQLGAGCTEVAVELSRILGFEVKNTEKLLRLIASQFHESFGELSGNVRSGEIDLESVLLGFARELTTAESGVIIEGRTALLLLDRPVDLKILLLREDTDRAELISKRRGIMLDEARHEMQKSDQERDNKVKELFNLNWLDPLLYDAVLNTSRMDHGFAASLIAQIVKSRGF